MVRIWTSIIVPNKCLDRELPLLRLLAPAKDNSTPFPHPRTAIERNTGSPDLVHQSHIDGTQPHSAS
jgi:hypothetical protein